MSYFGDTNLKTSLRNSKKVFAKLYEETSNIFCQWDKRTKESELDMKEGHNILET